VRRSPVFRCATDRAGGAAAVSAGLGYSSKGQTLVQEALDHMFRLLPTRTGSFEGSQYPLPVAQTFLGEDLVDLERLRRRLLESTDDDPKAVVTSLLIAAEQCEATSADRRTFFLDDATVRSLVFTGSKWRAGWVLVLDNKEREQTVELLKARDFMVFTDHAGIADTTYIGDRATSPIYFLQLMVRYALIWGGIAPGEDHRMGHFLEGFEAPIERLSHGLGIIDSLYRPDSSRSETAFLHIQQKTLRGNLQDHHNTAVQETIIVIGEGTSEARIASSF